MPSPLGASVLDQLATLQDMLQQQKESSATYVEQAETRAKEDAKKREERDGKFDELRQRLVQIAADCEQDRSQAGTGRSQGNDGDGWEQVLQLLKEHHRRSMEETVAVLEECKKMKQGSVSRAKSTGTTAWRG